MRELSYAEGRTARQSRDFHRSLYSHRSSEGGISGMTRTRAIYCFLAVASTAFAQASSDPTPEPVFSVSTTLVQVDAVVADSKGRQVKTLTCGDFSVLLDAKPQALTNCAYISLAGPALSSRTENSASGVGQTPIRPENVRRAVVMLVDDLNLSF